MDNFGVDNDLVALGALLLGVSTYVDGSFLGMRFGWPTGRTGRLGAPGWAATVTLMPLATLPYLYRRYTYLKAGISQSPSVPPAPAALTRGWRVLSLALVVAVGVWFVAVLTRLSDASEPARGSLLIVGSANLAVATASASNLVGRRRLAHPGRRPTRSLVGLLLIAWSAIGLTLYFLD